MIYFIAPKLSGAGGTETVIINVLNNMNKKGRPVKLLLSEDINKSNWLKKINKNIEIDINKHKGRIEKFIYLFKWSLRFNRIDKIVCLGANSIKYINIFRKLMNKKFTIFSWIHFSLINQEIFNSNNLKYADYHLAISTGIKKQLSGIGISPQKIFVVFNPINLKKGLIQNGSGPYKLIYIGRITFDGQKNLKEMLLALYYLHYKLKVDFQMDFFGSGRDLEKCKEFSKKLKLVNMITWHGWVDKPWEKINSASCTLLSSKFEGFPMVILESLSYGIPVISSDCPTGPEDLIIDNKNGCIYQLGNYADFAQKIFATLKNNYNHFEVSCTINKFETDKYIDNLIHALNHVY